MGCMGAFFTATSDDRLHGRCRNRGAELASSSWTSSSCDSPKAWPLSEAVIDAGAVRFRPMLLTAHGRRRRRRASSSPIRSSKASPSPSWPVKSPALLISRMAVPRALLHGQPPFCLIVIRYLLPIAIGASLGALIGILRPVQFGHLPTDLDLVAWCVVWRLWGLLLALTNAR